MPVRIPYMGEVSIMRIGTRQLKVRGPRKRNKPPFVFKTKSVPSETVYSLQARLALANAARAMRGHTFEEVIANVIDKCAGHTYKPPEAYEREREARYKRADANIERMTKKLRYLERYGAPPTEYERGVATRAFFERFE